VILHYILRFTFHVSAMKGKSSTIYILLILLCISIALIAIFIGCDDKKIDAPVLGSAAGSGPVGGGDTQKITLLASPSETVTALSTEQATVQVTALIENNIGQPMPDGTAVYWTTDVGTLDSTVTTSSNGSSTVTLTFPKDYTGCTWVVARSGDVEGGIRLCVTSVEPTATPSKVFIVTTDQSFIAWNGTATITATAKTDGTPDTDLEVQFTITGPGILSASADETDDSGIATVTLTGNNTSTTNQQTVTVTATTSDGRSGSVSIIVDQHP
jgi:hypothetical protein